MSLLLFPLGLSFYPPTPNFFSFPQTFQLPVPSPRDAMADTRHLSEDRRRLALASERGNSLSLARLRNFYRTAYNRDSASPPGLPEGYTLAAEGGPWSWPDAWIVECADRRLVQPLAQLLRPKLGLPPLL